ncbi:BORE2 protein, partial [Urocynchramus pylzowi]|nr:BORE2 protein [Urocynchramus pylzowi]
MAPGKAPCRRRSSDSGVEPDRGALPRDREQRTALSQKKRDQRIALFLSDFDQQAKEHIQEMRKELDSLLQTAEKAFAVELLTMPAAVRKMKRKDVLGEGAWPCARGAGSAVPGLREKTRELDLCFPCFANTFIVKVTTIVEYEDAKHSSAKKITKKVSLFCFYSKNIRT